MKDQENSYLGSSIKSLEPSAINQANQKQESEIEEDEDQKEVQNNLPPPPPPEPPKPYAMMTLVLISLGVLFFGSILFMFVMKHVNKELNENSSSNNKMRKLRQTNGKSNPDILKKINQRTVDRLKNEGLIAELLKIEEKKKKQPKFYIQQRII